MATWKLREPLNNEDWEDVEGDDVEDAIESWADRMDAPNDYFITKAGENSGVDIEVQGPGLDGIVKATVYPDFRTYYIARIKSAPLNAGKETQ